MSFKTPTVVSIGLILVLAVAGCLLYFFKPEFLSYKSPNSSANDAATSATALPAMQFEVVTTQADQARGLGGRKNIPDNYGMLFVFPTDVNVGFWMKDMLASIDMIWLSSNGTIVSITPSVSPATYPDVFYPSSPVRYVLETRAGFAASRSWKIGTKVSLPTPYGVPPLPYGK